MQSPHKSVLVNEVVDVFSDINGIFIDCTLGYAGHSQAILKNNKNLNLIACDQDIEAINFSKARLDEFKDRVKIIKTRFSQILNHIDKDEIKNIRGILADIGVSSLQLDKNDRGFSINSDTLDMRMDTSIQKSAFDIVNFYSQSELERIFFEYGEIPNAKFLAKKIVEYRSKKSINSSKELANIIGKKSVNNRSVSQAILAFQAIRIEVNKELDELKELLESIKNAGLSDCLVCIISFHSLEDRIVKNAFKSWQSSCICHKDAFRCECGNNHSLGKIITKKAITAGQDEIKLNSRSSCAKMRVFKIGNKNV